MYVGNTLYISYTEIIINSGHFYFQMNYLYNSEQYQNKINTTCTSKDIHLHIPILATLFRPFGFLASKDFKFIWFSQIFWFEL